MRETRSHTKRPSTTNALASSATPRLTTETTMGSPAGEYSKQSLAQCRSSIHSSSTPASNVEAKSTLTRALSWKSPAGGTPSNVAALSMDSALRVEPAPGSMKMSLCGSPVTLIVPAGPSTVHATPEDGGEREGHAGCSKSRHLISDLQVKVLVGPQLRAAIRVVTVSILSVGGVGRFHSAARARSGRPHISDGC